MNSSIESQDSPDAGFDSADPAPRFGIFHLLSLTAAIALAFALSGATSDALTEKSPEVGQMRTLGLLMAAFNGLYYAGMVWVLKWGLEANSKLKPGHWLGVATGATALIASMSFLYLYRQFSFQELMADNNRTLALFYTVPKVVPAVLYGIASWKSKKIWNWIFAGFAIYYLLIVFSFVVTSDDYSTHSFEYYQWFSFAMRCTIYPALILFIVAVVIDCWSRRGDWLHWFGIVAFTCHIVIESNLFHIVNMFST